MNLWVEELWVGLKLNLKRNITEWIRPRKRKRKTELDSQFSRHKQALQSSIHFEVIEFISIPKRNWAVFVLKSFALKGESGNQKRKEKPITINTVFLLSISTQERIWWALWGPKWAVERDTQTKYVPRDWKGINQKETHKTRGSIHQLLTKTLWQFHLYACAYISDNVPHASIGHTKYTHKGQRCYTKSIK